MMPPKRSFTDDYTGGPNQSPTSSNFLPPKRRKTYTGGANDWRRPSASSARDAWWAVSEAEWERMAPAMKMNWTHVGRIMETEEGEPAPEACEQCRDAGDPRGCWVYSREAMRRYGFKTHVCARCRATANVCSLNPFFRNSVGLRDNRPPPERPPPHDSPYHHPPPSESRHRFPSPGPPEHHRYRSVTPPSERHGRGWPQSPTAKRHSFDDRERYPPPPASERHIFPSPGPPHHHHHHQRRLSPTPPSPHHHPHHHRPHLSQSDLQPLPATGGAPPPHPNDPSSAGGIPPPHPHSAPPLLSLDSLAARLEVLEQQMDALRKDNVYIHEENNILRWRLADLEAPLQAQAQAAASSAAAAAAAAATLTTAGAEVGEQDDDAADRKPVMTTTNTTTQPPPPQQQQQPQQQRSSASSRAIETLVMEESMASSLREQEQHEHEQQAETDRRRHDAAAEEEERQRRRRAEEEEEEERERERAEERARREQGEAEHERHRLQVAAELEALRDESAELGRKVGELEKGHGVTQQILRNMYYALD